MSVLNLHLFIVVIFNELMIDIFFILNNDLIRVRRVERANKVKIK
jgi:hypothetical protein